MTVETAPIAGAALVTFPGSADHRGSFARTFSVEVLEQLGPGRRVIQSNHSITHARGAIRGMHYQLPPHAEIKLVRCIHGAVFDVIIDLRAGSPTLLKWYGAVLNADNRRTMFVPEGCAHGFQVLEPDSELVYFHTAPYSPPHEQAVRYDDPAVGIQWPLPVSDVSDRDQRHPLVGGDFSGIVV